MERTIRFEGTNTKVLIKDENEHIQRFWLRKKFYESEHKGLFNRKGMLREVYKRSPKGGKFIDIGASIGNHSLFFGNVMKGEVIAFEPYAESYAHLLENVQLNNLQITAYNIALGSKTGMVALERLSTDNIGMINVRYAPATQDTELFPLDSFYNDVYDYDVIKIDVENYNSQVLAGASRVLSNGSGDVYIEAAGDQDLMVLDITMRSYGYTRVPHLVMNSTATYLYTK